MQLRLLVAKGAICGDIMAASNAALRNAEGGQKHSINL